MWNSGKQRSITILVSVILALPLLSACLGGDTTPTPTVSTDDNAGLLKQAIAAMKELKSYHIAATVDSEGRTTALSGDVDVAGNKSSLVASNGGKEMTVIVVGETAYVSDNSGADYKPAPVEELNLDNVLGIWQRFKPEDVDRTADSLKDGTPATETINGVTTKHIVGDAVELTAVTDPGRDTGQTGTVEFWISTGETTYIHRMRMKMQEGAESTEGTFDWSAFNETFDIKAP